MAYLKSLFHNFLVVFFANYLLPGIEILNQTKIPHLGADLPFAIGLSILNSLIFPLFKFTKKPVTAVRIALATLVLNFVVYALLKVLPIGIDMMTIEGYIFPALVVSIGSFLINFFEMKRHSHLPSSHPPRTEIQP